MKFSCFEDKGEMPEKVITPSFGGLIYRPEDIVDRLKKVDSLSQLDINRLIYEYHKVILDYDLFFNNPDNREAAQKAFSNERFLLCLLAAIPSLHLNAHQIICCNKLAYDYIQYTGDMENRISSLLLQLSSVVNRNLVLSLSGIIGYAPAQYLALVAHSSFSDKKNIRRILNFLLYNIEGYTTQDLLNIYQRLFERITTFFIETMNYVIDHSTLTDEQSKNDQTISISLLDILMNMTSADMGTLLKDYGTNYFLHHNGRPVRVSLQHLNEKYYGRIINVVRMFDDDTEVIIP